MQDLVVYNQPTPCPYLPGQTARMPLRRPFRLTPRGLDERLAQGDRRLGQFLYRTQCPACNACEPIRIPVADFMPVRTHRRILRKGKELLSVRVGRPECDDVRVALYNRHKFERELNQDDGDVDLAGYYDFLVDTCCQTLEISYWHGEQLVAVAISDRGEKSLNAVYCYFDPSFPALSLGTYNVLQQVELCREWGLDYLYLGFYIASSPHMRYKANFKPHERLHAGVWERFARE